MSEQLVIEEQPKSLAVPTPANLIALAMSQGVDPDKLCALMDLQMRWEANEQRKAYIKALHDFRQHAPTIVKTKVVAYKDVRYTYAELDKICEVLIPELGKYGLSVGWNPEPSENGKIRVSCTLSHRQGHRQVEATMDGPPDTTGSKNAVQAIGSTTKYLQKYTFLAAVGVTPKGDDDGRTGEELPEQAVKDWIASIEGASTVDELKLRYEKAKEAAAKLSDGDAVKQFVAAKDKRYVELRRVVGQR